MKATKKAFTLIEMLIVIVIIGILAAALVPRLISVQGRARDTKRKADTAQIGGGLAVYKVDVGTFPAYTGNANIVLVGPLVTSGYLTSMPTDPANAGVGEIAASSTGYGYMAALRNSITANGAAVIAATETDGTSSNFVRYTMTPTTDMGVVDGLIGGCGGKVTKASSGAPVTTAGACTATGGDLRYYYTQ